MDIILSDIPPEIWQSLTVAEQQICVLRFGVTKWYRNTLEETERLTGYTRQQIRIAESKVLSQMKHPTQAQ